MDRFSVSLEAELLAQFDEHIRRRGYQNRSEAVRDIIRQVLEAERLSGEDGGFCVACLSYVYDHHERELPRRLIQTSHAHHELTVSTMHAHLNHQACVEVSILRGSTSEVRHFADSIIAETGVRHGAVNIVPMELDATDGSAHPHVHYHPKT